MLKNVKKTTILEQLPELDTLPLFFMEIAALSFWRTPINKNKQTNAD